MRKTLIMLALAATVLATSAPVQAKIVTRRSVWFLAPTPLGPRAAGVVAPCSTTADELNGVSFHDRIVRAPRGADLLIVYLFPDMDWDLYLCRKGKQLSSSTGSIGVTERAAIRVRPGYSYRIRALNWAGEYQVSGTYAFYNT